MEVARKDDATFGTCSIDGPQAGKILTSCSKTKAEGKLISRVGDIVIANCGHLGIINLGSSTIIVENKNVARKGDTFIGTYTGIIIEGAPTVIAG